MTSTNTPIVSHVDVALGAYGEVGAMPMSEVGQLSLAISAAEKRVVAAGQETAADLLRGMAAMQAKFEALAQENLRLQEQLVAAESRENETKKLHAQELAAVQGEKEAAKQEVLAFSQKMVETMQNAEARVAVEIAARAEAVRAATQVGAVHVAQAQQETEAARKEIEAAHQAADQRVAVVLAEMDAAVQATQQAGIVQLAAALGERDAIEAQLRHKMNVAEDLANRLQREKNSLIKAMALHITAARAEAGPIFESVEIRELVKPFWGEITRLIPEWLRRYG